MLAWLLAQKNWKIALVLGLAKFKVAVLRLSHLWIIFLAFESALGTPGVPQGLRDSGTQLSAENRVCVLGTKQQGLPGLPVY